MPLKLLYDNWMQLSMYILQNVAFEKDGIVKEKFAKLELLISAFYLFFTVWQYNHLLQKGRHRHFRVSSI